MSKTSRITKPRTQPQTQTRKNGQRQSSGRDEAERKDHTTSNLTSKATSKASKMIQPQVQVQSTTHQASPDALPNKVPKPAITDSSDHPDSREAMSLTKDPKVILPLELEQLKSSSKFTMISISTSSKMEKNVSKLLRHLGETTLTDQGLKPTVVMLGARQTSASKLVSIVEIAKTSLEQAGEKWYQYTNVSGAILPPTQARITRPNGGKAPSDGPIKTKQPTKSTTETTELLEVEDTVLIGHEDEEDEDAFETMGSAGMPARAVPVIKIFLSRVSVPGLEEMYG